MTEELRIRELEDLIDKNLNTVVLISDHAELEFARHSKKTYGPFPEPLTNIFDYFTHLGIILRRSRGIKRPRPHLFFSHKDVPLYFPVDLIRRTELTDSFYEKFESPDNICYIPTALGRHEIVSKNRTEVIRRPTKHNWNIRHHLLSKNYDLNQRLQEIKHATLELMRREYLSQISGHGAYQKEIHDLKGN